MENKNFVLAMVLMLVVWLGFSIFFPPQEPVVQDDKQTAVVSSETEKSAEVSIPVEKPASSEPILPQITGAKDINIENDVFKAVFSTAGGCLKSFILKNFTETADANSPQVILVNQEKNILGTLRTRGRDGFGLDSNLLYAVSTPDNSILLSGSEEKKIVFTGSTENGIIIEKTFLFKGNSYDFDLQIRLVNQSSNHFQGGINIEMVFPWEDSMGSNRLAFFGPASLVGKELKTEKVEELKKAGVVYGSDVIWSGFETKYFLTAGMPRNFSLEKVRVEYISGTVRNNLEIPYFELNAGEQKSVGFKFYYGPRDLDILKKTDENLSRAIDFGFFSILARPLLHILKFFYAFLGNYGLSIIFLTVIIKGLFWPLTQKSYSSMKAMQVLQPQMQKIREKYKNDRERLNKEIMELYKTHRVNPLGGCLPMLVQIPVFFALYKVLLDAIELRHAPFYFWITDLSAKDPYYITPLIMGVTMFIQQKMTPSTMDPTQAKVFMLMPLIFTFIFLNFPSGLVIYWLINNLLTILQQYFIHKQKA